MYMKQVIILARRQERLLLTVRRHKLSWLDHVCHHNTLPKIILQGTMDDSRRRGRPCKSWKDTIEQLTDQSMSSLLCIADDGSQWASVGVPRLSLSVTEIR